jgi:hypothetical protein
MHVRTALSSILVGLAATCAEAPAADHNDPNAINSIFSDIDVSAADLYDLFGFPSDDGKNVIVALTFASVPKAGTLDPDLLYRLRFYAAPRVPPASESEQSVQAMLHYFDAVRDKYLHANPLEVRVTVDANGKATVGFLGFPSGNFSETISTNTVTTLRSRDKQPIKAFVGGRDDAFFNDLPGFFRSINYAPQFYHVPLSMTQARELKIPKSLIELDGNKLFNFDPQKPLLGRGVKEDLPAEPLTWTGTKFFKDANGNYRFAYSGKDAQAGKNVNAVILEMPLTFVTTFPEVNRIVNVWGESWVLKASHKAPTIPDDRRFPNEPYLQEHPWVLPAGVIGLGFLLFAHGLRHTIAADGTPRRRRLAFASGVVLILLGTATGLVLARWYGPGSAAARDAADVELARYKLVDTDGQPFADAALNEREDDRQLGADNFWLAPHFVLRLAHLGWGFGPSISALGLKTSFDHDNSPVSIYKTYDNVLEAFPRVKRTLFQHLNMPDDSWNKHGLNIPLRRPIDIFVPNVCAIDMDTTGTWPFGRRLEDQVATRFLSMFLDMEAEIAGKKYNVELMNDPALWANVPIEPKTPPNPTHNDKPFLTEFPYLAEPW